MRFRNRDERQLERDLRSLSSQPDNDFVLRITGRVTRGHVAARASRTKVGLALSLTALGVIIFAVFGGLGYASSAAQKATTVVSVVNVASNTKAIAVTTSSSSKSTSSTPSTNGSSSATSSSSSSPKGNPTKTTICHATASSSNPFVEITVDDNALAAHRAHQGLEDIIPAPASGCPKGGDSGSGGGGGSCSGSGDSGSSDSGSSDSGSGSGKSKSNGSGDSKSGDSDSGSGGGGAGGSQYGGCIPICHSIGSGKYVLLLVGSGAIAAHQGHGDIIPAPAAGCPGDSSGGDDKPKCNSGRGNGSEGNSSQLIQPGTGNKGTSPTVDCDPGNSGAKNKGGD